MNLLHDANHGPIRDLIVHRQLFARLVPSDIQSRYMGSAFGLVWSMATPILLLLNYWFFLGVVLKAKWGVDGSGDYPLMLFSGIVVYQFFAEVLGRAPNLIISHGAYVRKVVFPIEILSWVTVSTALFHLAVNFGILLLAQLLLRHELPITWIWLPLVLVPLVFFSVGVSWFVSSLAVYLRDIAQVVPLMLTFLMFLSPIFYPMEMVPPKYRAWLALNPLTPTIEQVRAVTAHGQNPDLFVLGIQYLVAVVAAVGGYWWFARTKKGFADVL
jgi:lipopolysaccharide transport system permease protein